MKKFLLPIFSFCLVFVPTLLLPLVVFGQETPAFKVMIPLLGKESFKDFREYLQTIYELILVIAVMLSFLYIIWGGVEYINPLVASKQTAKERITKAIVGLLIVLGTYFLLNLINPDIFKVTLF